MWPKRYHLNFQNICPILVDSFQNNLLKIISITTVVSSPSPAYPACLHCDKVKVLMRSNLHEHTMNLYKREKKLLLIPGYTNKNLVPTKEIPGRIGIFMIVFVVGKRMRPCIHRVPLIEYAKQDKRGLLQKEAFALNVRKKSVLCLIILVVVILFITWIVSKLLSLFYMYTHIHLN